MAEAHEQLQELREDAEKALVSRMAPVSLTMAMLAVMVAVVSLLGHRAHTEEILLQTKLTDQWAYYQAKNVRRDAYEIVLDQIEMNMANHPESAGRAKKKYQAALEREQDRQSEIQAEARKLEADIAYERNRANRFDLGEGLLEAALVMTSITLLTRRRVFWYCGSAMAAIGVVVALTAFAIH